MFAASQYKHVDQQDRDAWSRLVLVTYDGPCSQYPHSSKHSVNGQWEHWQILWQYNVHCCLTLDLALMAYSIFDPGLVTHCMDDTRNTTEASFVPSFSVPNVRTIWLLYPCSDWQKRVEERHWVGNWKLRIGTQLGKYNFTIICSPVHSSAHHSIRRMWLTGEGAEHIYHNVALAGSFNQEVGIRQAGFIVLGLRKLRRDLIEKYKTMRGFISWIIRYVSP